MTAPTREDIIRMAREVGFSYHIKTTDDIAILERFFKAAYAAGAAAKDEEHKEALRWDVHSCGPTCSRYACVATRKAVADEREAMLDLVDSYAKNNTDLRAAIRARGITPDSQHPN